MTTKESRLGGFVLRGGPEAPLHVISMVGNHLAKHGEVTVSWEIQRVHTASSSTLEDHVNEVAFHQAIDNEIEDLQDRLVPYCRDIELADQERVDRSSRTVDVYVVFRSNTIYFTEAPWHPANCKGGKEHHRLVEMVKKGKPFTAVYVFDDQPNHREDGPGTLRQNLSNVVDGASLSVTRRDWPHRMFNGKSRVDIRIVPKEGRS